MYNYSFDGLNYPMFYPNRRYTYNNSIDQYFPYSRSFPRHNHFQNQSNFSTMNHKLNKTSYGENLNKNIYSKEVNNISNSNANNSIPDHVNTNIDGNLNIDNMNINNDKINSSKHKNSTTENTSRCTICNESNQNEQPFFRVFGLDLFFDDILILCLLFFLYTEEVKDEMLFICLILLLLS